MKPAKTILLADDDSKDVELTLAALKEHNLDKNVVVVKDGTEVLDYLWCREKYQKRGQGNPTVVLLDIKMPKMDGFEVLRTIKADPELQSIPVVMLTSSREIKDLVATHKLGSVAYIVKPVNFTNFVDSIKQLGVFRAIIDEFPVENRQEKERCES